MPSALAVFRLIAGPMRSGMMSQLGQTRKCSYGAYVFRSYLNSRHRSARHPPEIERSPAAMAVFARSFFKLDAGGRRLPVRLTTRRNGIDRCT
jgi:hypothetical protein